LRFESLLNTPQYQHLVVLRLRTPRNATTAVEELTARLRRQGDHRFVDSVTITAR